MRNTLAFLVLAAGFSQVTAAAFGFVDAPSYTSPGNSDNQCTPDMQKGFDWSDLSIGNFNSYKGFLYSGYQCSENFQSNSPKISCDNSQGVEKASIRAFQVTPEFDCDLDCKQRASLQASGTTVKNTQCGGAADVTIDTCEYGIHQIDFDCAGTKPGKRNADRFQYPTDAGSPSYPTYPTGLPSSPAASPIPTPEVSSEIPTSSSVETSPTPGDTAAETGPTMNIPDSYPVYTISTSNTTAAQTASTPSVTPGSYSGYTPIISSASVESTPAESIVPESTVAQTSAIDSSVVSPVSSFPVTPNPYPAYTPSTSGVPVDDTPAQSSVVGSSGVSPVTSSPETSNPYPAYTPSTSGAPVESTPAESTVAEIASPASQTSSGPVGPVGPAGSSTCPDVVPSCLNTWLSEVKCKDNTDSACYCLDSNLVNNVYSCLYAHGETDEIISEAIIYFQGICAPYVSSNPGIATGAADITTVLTVSPTPFASYTTIGVTATTIVPCTNEVGETIPSSSSTVVISTAMTVPQVVFTTITAATGADTPSVGIVPGTYPAFTATATPTTPIPASSGVFAPYPAGTGSAFSTYIIPPSGYPMRTPATPSVIPTGSAARVIVAVVL
ncbi:hypothetical protein GGR50DRAFT_686428 [Xylaria sp. CBS 124048]|nr:hypothetical protein GGR50DRAFT_686428 [Xylaria sp. CBS 124048]